MSRLTHALDIGAIALPEDGAIVVSAPSARYDLSDLPKERVTIVSTFKPDHDVFENAGFPVAFVLPEAPRVAIVVAGRSKALNRARVAEAMASGAAVIVDGGKDEGVDSLYRDLKKRVAVSPAIAKAHGKVFSIEGEADLSDWLPGAMEVDGFQTWPGVFSADGIDPASALLVGALPPLNGAVGDLGAGWGYLAHEVLEASPGVTSIDLVEADAQALACARENVKDARARFHWADATRWRPGAKLDAVIMNPPFHVGHAADPSLGAAFIDAASRGLAPKGSLWLVANRQLPYEAPLNERFQSVTECPGTSRFKIFRATHPRR